MLRRENRGECRNLNYPRSRWEAGSRRDYTKWTKAAGPPPARQPSGSLPGPTPSVPSAPAWVLRPRERAAAYRFH
jgi:hypothetical protein